MIEQEKQPIERSKEPSLADKAVEKKLQDLAGLEQDLATAGVTNEQIQAARKITETRIREEFAERDRQDPLTIVDLIIQHAAQTDNDKLIAQVYHRTLSSDYIRGPLHHVGQKPRDARDIFVCHSQGYLKIDERLNYGRDDKETWVEITALGGINDKNLSTPSEEFMTKVLTDLGVLNDVHPKIVSWFTDWFPTLDERSWCESQPLGPVNIKDDKTRWITRIPTNIPGVQAGFNMCDKMIKVLFSLDALKNVQSLEEPWTPRY